MDTLDYPFIGSLIEYAGVFIFPIDENIFSCTWKFCEREKEGVRKEKGERGEMEKVNQIIYCFAFFPISHFPFITRLLYLIVVFRPHWALRHKDSQS